MSQDNVLPTQRIARYNLTIAFEELYTQDDTQLHASANAVGEVARAIEQFLITDTALQELLKAQKLTLHIISPSRVSAGQGASDSRRNGPCLSNEQKDRHP